jgi:hypothetical protein
MRVVWKPRTASRLLLKLIKQRGLPTETPLRIARTDFVVRQIKNQLVKLHLGNRFEIVGANQERLGFKFGNYGLVKKISPIHSGTKIDLKAEKKYPKNKKMANLTKKLKKKSYIYVNPEAKKKFKFKKLGSFANKFLLKKLFKN